MHSKMSFDSSFVVANVAHKTFFLMTLHVTDDVTLGEKKLRALIAKYFFGFEMRLLKMISQAIAVMENLLADTTSVRISSEHSFVSFHGKDGGFHAHTDFVLSVLQFMGLHRTFNTSLVVTDITYKTFVNFHVLKYRTSGKVKLRAKVTKYFFG